MMLAPDLPQTRDPLPAGVTVTTIGGPCRTCGPADIVFSLDNSWTRLTTRSVDPGPDGRYVIQGHNDWCPVWSGKQPRVAAPCCGAPVRSFHVTYAYWIVVPGAGPNGSDGYHLSTGDTEARWGALASKRERAPQFDKATLHPCGHTVEGDDVRRVATDVNAAVAADRATTAEAAIERHQDVLTAAEAAGYEALAERYRAAVRGGDKTAAGLLEALRTLTAPGVGR